MTQLIFTAHFAIGSMMMLVTQDEGGLNCGGPRSRDWKWRPTQQQPCVSWWQVPPVVGARARAGSSSLPDASGRVSHSPDLDVDKRRRFGKGRLNCDIPHNSQSLSALHQDA